MAGKRTTNGEVRRRGAVVVVTAVLMVVLLGFAALAIDLGHLYVVKTELQSTADAAALAGVMAIASDDQLESNEAAAYQDMTANAAAWAGQVAALNVANKTSPVLDSSDIVLGLFDFDQPSAPLSLNGSVNAVQVTVRFTGESDNGPVDHWFAPVLGRANSDVEATAIAAFDDRFSGYAPTQAGPLIPYTIYLHEFNDQIVNGPDNYGYDPDLDAIESFPDGIPEINVFPYQSGGGDGAGNFGLLYVGAPNQGVPTLSTQIENGITPAELEAEVGVPQLTFYDEEGAPVAYLIAGNPGMKNGVEPSVEARVGDVVGVFIHSQLVGQGANATYTIVKIAFGRCMGAQLTGNPDNRFISIQPTVYSGPEIMTDPNAPSSGGLMGRILLVR